MLIMNSPYRFFAYVEERGKIGVQFNNQIYTFEYYKYNKDQYCE